MNKMNEKFEKLEKLEKNVESRFVFLKTDYELSILYQENNNLVRYYCKHYLENLENKLKIEDCSLSIFMNDVAFDNFYHFYSDMVYYFKYKIFINDAALLELKNKSNPINYIYEYIITNGKCNFLLKKQEQRIFKSLETISNSNIKNSYFKLVCNFLKK